MPKKKYLIILLSIILLPFFSYSATDPVYFEKYAPDIKKTGEGTYRPLYFKIYSAVLYTPDGFYSENKPVVLNITFHKSVSAVELVDKIISEIKEHGNNDPEKLSKWKIQLLKIYSDVETGTNMTAIYTKQNSLIFLKDGIKQGEMKDPEFSRNFFDIWLSEKTSMPRMRRKLLGKM